jgi:excisionase family DNA binding protein
MSTLLSDAALAEITEAVARRLPQHVAKRLYTVQEAAEYMGCSPQQVRNWITAGRLPNVSLDARARVAIEDIQRLIEEGKSA